MASEFSTLLENELPSLTGQQLSMIDRFRNLVLAENEIQNLTRIIEPRAFLEGHVLDCIELEKSGFLKDSCLDLGTGLGVPGLVCALLDQRRWVLCESEKRKTEFLDRAIGELGLGERVTAVGERAEDYLATHSCEAVVVRAVGPVSRIYGWLKRCSTWNTLVLLKGPAWDEEWAEFQRTGQRNQLKITGSHRYQTGSERKERLIVELTRQ